MATINFQPPIANVPASINGPTVLGIAANTHCNEADFVKINAGGVIPCVAGDFLNIAGIIQQDSAAVFSQGDTDVQGVFGTTQLAGGLYPPTPGYVLVVPLGAPIIVEMSLPATTGWITGGTTQVGFGSVVGLNKDATTGFYFADPTQANPIGTIVGKVFGPNRGAAGDTGGRVLVALLASALAIQQGH